MFHWRPPLNQTASASLQRLHERLGVGDLRIVRVQHPHVLQPALHPRLDDALLVVGADAAVVVPVAAGRRHDDELLVGAAGELDELLDDAGAVRRAAADDHERAFRRAVVGGLLKGPAPLTTSSANATIRVENQRDEDSRRRIRPPEGETRELLNRLRTRFD